MSADTIRHTIAHQQGRDQRADALDDGGCTITGTMTWEGQHQPERHVMFKLGTMQERPPPAATSATAAPAPGSTDQPAPQDVQGNAEGISTTADVSVDAALFPFLFPGGRGAFRSGKSLSQMLQQRVQQLFSPFTLIKEYLLVMFQVTNAPACSMQSNCMNVHTW